LTVVRVLAPRWLLLRRVPFLVFVAFLTLVTWAPAADRDVWTVAGWSFCLVAGVLVTGLDLIRRAGVELRADAVVVLGSFRRREVPWRDVREITLGGCWLGWTTLHLADGGKVLCEYPRFPLLVPRRRAEADYRRLAEWWLAHRGPDWHPAPQRYPSPLPPVVEP
jgi:hypothetical protein